MAVNGNDILVLAWNEQQQDWEAVAHARTSEIQVDGEVIEISSPAQGQWREFLAGRKEWALTLGYLVFANSDVQRLIDVGSTVTLLIKGRGAADSTGLTGTAIIKTAKQTYTRGNLVAGSFAFQGSGPLEIPT